MAEGRFLIVPPIGKSLSKPMGWLGGCWEPPLEHLSLKQPLLEEVLDVLDIDLLNCPLFLSIVLTGVTSMISKVSLLSAEISEWEASVNMNFLNCWLKNGITLQSSGLISPKKGNLREAISRKKNPPYIPETIPLERAESRLLFSEELLGVLAGLELLILVLVWPLICNVLGEFTENRLEVKMSMSAWVISSSIDR